MERLMKETRRRTHTVGIFANAASCDLLDHNGTWQCERMGFLGMERLDERPVIPAASPKTATAGCKGESMQRVQYSPSSEGADQSMATEQTASLRHHEDCFKKTS